MNSRFLHIHEGVNVQAHSHETFYSNMKRNRKLDRPHYKQGMRAFLEKERLFFVKLKHSYSVYNQQKSILVVSINRQEDFPVNTRRILSLSLCLVFFAFMMSNYSSVSAFAAQAISEPITEPIESGIMASSFMSIIQDDGYDRSNIKSITFLDTFDSVPSDARVWDFSMMRDQSVQAWATEEGAMFIAGKGGVTATGCHKLFEKCSHLTTINFNGCFYTAGIEDFSMMFNGCGKLTEIDLSTLDTSSATNMSAMFRNCCDLATADFSSFNTSHVTDMTEMFSGCSNLVSIDLSSFETSNVTSMKSMFDGCGWTASINVSSFNTSSVIDFSRMFLNCQALSDLNLSSFDFNAAKDLSHMFMWDENLTDIGCTIVVPEGALNEKMYANSGLN